LKKEGTGVIEYKGKNFVCFMDLGMELIKGKWKAVILCHLNDGPKRFLELQRITKGISQKVLNQKLKELEEDGLITKTIYPQVPPRVEFQMTPLAEELYPALDIIQQWSLKNFK